MSKEPKEEPLAFRIKRAHGELANPFKLAQARDVPRAGVLREFFPTSIYWSRFNHTNEVLLGTRGSGKTILLRMLSFSHYSASTSTYPRIQSLEHRYFGIYIPLRLELLREISSNDGADTQREKFCFIFNCVAVSAFLREIGAILASTFENDEIERLVRTRKIIDYIYDLWELPPNPDVTSLPDVAREVNSLYLHVRTHWEKLAEIGALKLGLLEPIIASLSYVNVIIGVSSDNCSWLACFDEAEYLPEHFQTVINTLMRSEIGGLVVKVATLPMHWTESGTAVEEISVQAGGDDFVFTNIDYGWDSEDFGLLSNKLLIARLLQTDIFEPDDFEFESALEQFLGRNNDKSLVALYQSVFGDDSNLEDNLLSDLRGRPKGKAETQDSSGQIKRYMPVYILRRLFSATRKGNTRVPWLAGARMARRVSGGNARRLIQLYDLYFEHATQQLLKPNVQHDAVASYAERFCERASSVYQEGFLLQRLLVKLARFLHEQFHKGPIRDLGLEIELSQDILDDERMREAFESGIGYSYFNCSDEVLQRNKLIGGVKLRLADAIGAANWVPMRSGDGTMISLKSSAGKLLFEDVAVLTPKGVERAIDEVQLDFFEENAQ